MVTVAILLLVASFALAAAALLHGARSLRRKPMRRDPAADMEIAVAQLRHTIGTALAPSLLTLEQALARFAAAIKRSGATAAEVEQHLLTTTTITTADSPCIHWNFRLDRTMCACGLMHYRCDHCGAQLTECERPAA